jgi:hypothetical protein
MKKIAYFLISTLILFTASAVQADTIELADGTLLEGDFIGSSNGIIMFNTGSSIEAFPEDKVVGIFLSSGVAGRNTPCHPYHGCRRHQQARSGAPFSRATGKRTGGWWQYRGATGRLCSWSNHRC